MLAETVHIDILHNDQLIMILVEYRPVDNIPEILLVPLREEHHRLRIPLRRPMQTLPIRIFSYALQDCAHRTRKLCEASLCLLLTFALM